MDENRWSVGETEFKVYLRKTGLGLTGKKKVLMDRIKEHLGIIDGGGEQKYLVSSFVYNCKVIIEAEIIVRKVVDYWSYNSKKETCFAGVKNQGAT
ncbi:hypothetical protein C5167_007248 [Papaver somniferum]|nr:hypothetical protein C5167_007248 [Papaver somniferum]